MGCCAYEQIANARKHGLDTSVGLDACVWWNAGFGKPSPEVCTTDYYFGQS
jgi:hypothetical protein